MSYQELYDAQMTRKQADLAADVLKWELMDKPPSVVKKARKTDLAAVLAQWEDELSRNRPKAKSRRTALKVKKERAPRGGHRAAKRDAGLKARYRRNAAGGYNR